MIPDLRAYRKFKGITQLQLGAELNLAKSTISMIESNDRELPAEALVLFEALLARETDLPELQTEENSLTLTDVRQMNTNQGQKALLDHQKECEFALHKYERQMDKWEKRYDKALTAYLFARGMIAKMADKKEEELPPGYMSKLKSDSIKALQVLMQIGNQKPSLVIVKIAGLKEELRMIALLLKNPDDNSGEDSVGLPWGS